MLFFFTFERVFICVKVQKQINKIIHINLIIFKSFHVVDSVRAFPLFFSHTTCVKMTIHTDLDHLMTDIQRQFFQGQS